MFNLIGKTLGPYRILEQIGMGGMATVYKAYQPSMDRFVAIKVLPPHFSQDEQFIKRFEREAHAIAKLEHAHILPSFDYGECEGVTYIAMRYIQAGTLKELLSKGLLPLDEIARIIGQISSALQYSHQLGIIHRDVKPSNVLIGEQGNIYLTDFGLAHIVDSKQHLTGTGVGVGTPAYTSPEQGLGNKTDHRSDIYSLGVVLYEMVTGHVPYEAETPMAVVLKHINEPMPLPSSIKPGVPESVELVILKALEKDPAHRYQSAGELAEALSIAIRKVKVAEASTETIPRPSTAKPKSNWLRSPWKPIIIGGAGLTLLFLGILISRMPGKIPLTDVQPAFGVTPTLSLTIAPDGVEAITCNGAENGQICLWNRKTGTTQITHSLSFQGQMGSKSWSPDGKQIAFSGAKTANDPQKLYIINRDDTGLRQITSGNTYDHEVAWSPDGQWIAFHRDCSIWLIHPDGTQNHLLLENEPNKFCNEGPSWSPNSQEISILRLFDDERPSEIWVVNIDGSNPHSICTLDEPVEMGWQAFSPDGSMVTARYLIDDQWTNFLMNVDGSEMHEIDHDLYWWNTQFWTPWGKEIAQ